MQTLDRQWLKILFNGREIKNYAGKIKCAKKVKIE